MAYSGGWQQTYTFKLDGAGGATTLAIKSASWEETVAALDSSNTSSSGVEACIRGILRGGGTVTAGIDGANLPNAAAPGITAGAKGTITMTVGSSTPWSAHVLVTKLNNSWQEMDGMLMYNFDVKLDSTSGAYTRPT